MNILTKPKSLLGTFLALGFISTVGLVWAEGNEFPGNHLSSNFSETVDTIVATQKVDPWAPKGMESVWSHGSNTHPLFMEIRRAEYEKREINSESKMTYLPWFMQGRI